MIQRKIASIKTPHLHQGFLGQGHLAAAVIDGNNFVQTDPFILLMDDQLDLPGGPPVGGPHHHAGFETITLVLQGNEKDWKTGSLELMTAGSGIIHTEEITSQTKMRILQLWLVLPPEKRWADPFLQQILLEDVPTQKTENYEIRVYSGTNNGLTSPLQNHTPVTIVDFKLEKVVKATQEIPTSYNGFIYVINGTVKVGEAEIAQGQVAWFDNLGQLDEHEIIFTAGEQETRFIFYAGEPQKAQVISHGPFIGDTKADVARLYQEYRHGKMPHLNDLPENRKIRHSKANNEVHLQQ